MHRHFDDAETGVLNLLHHLDADDPARLDEVDAVEDRAPHQAKITVNVPQPDTDQRTDDMVIDAADDDAVQWIGAADLVAVHHVGPGRHTGPEYRELGGVVLRIAVGVENQLFGRRAEAGPERGA